MSGYNLTGLSLNNFRVFGKETSLSLAPLTILTGTNSSGKSSFTKALKLLTRSYKINGLRSLALMEGDLKLGDYNSIKNSANLNDEIFFSLEVVPRNSQILIRNERKELLIQKERNGFSINNGIFKIDLCYGINGLKSLKFFKDSVLLLEQAGELNKSNEIKESFIKIPETFIKITELKRLFSSLSDSQFNLIYQSIFNYLQTSVEAHSFSEYDSNNRKIRGIDILQVSYNRILNGLSQLGKYSTYQEHEFDEELQEYVSFSVNEYYGANPKLIEILPKSILEICDQTILNEYLSKYLNTELISEAELLPANILSGLFLNIQFIDGVRATQEIIYTKDNSPGFYEIIEKYYSSDVFTNQFLEKWMIQKFKLLKLEKGQHLKDIFSIEQIPGYGYKIQILQAGLNVGLSGLGYGASQLLPILIKISLFSDCIFIIEEPESNLHPALQSELADFFVSALNGILYLGIRQFIIETHSEYLIRKLQYLTAKESIGTDVTQIYYFNHPDNVPKGEEQVKKININKDGSLTDDFGEGFFDEADKIALELFLLTQVQKN